MGKALAVAVALMTFALAGVVMAADHGGSAMAAKPAPFTALGAWSGLPAMTALIRQYEADQKARFINFMPADNDQLPGRLSRHRCDVGLTIDSILPDPLKKEAAQFEGYPVGCFVIGVIVNAKSSVRAISLDDLRRVFTGEITLWKDVGGSSGVGRVEPFRPPAAGTQGMLFQKKVLADCWYVDPPLAQPATARNGKGD